MGGSTGSSQSRPPDDSSTIMNDHDDFTTSSTRDLQMLYQDQAGSGSGWECSNLDVVDACRGTSVSKIYRGNFEVYHGPCRGSFLEGMPIYKSTDRPNQPLYIYALDRYPQSWSYAPLRGLVRWRIASFNTFDDKTSCRIENANIFQLEFAADGHPYDYFPTIYCFDAQGADTTGYQTSSINIRCNDVSPATGGGATLGDVSPPRPNSLGDQTKRKNAGVVIAVLGVLMIVVAITAFAWQKYREQVRLPSYMRAGEASEPSDEASQFHDEPDQEQPSMREKKKRKRPQPHSQPPMFTVQNLRHQLNESGHALRAEVVDFWASIHSRGSV